MSSEVERRKQGVISTALVTKGLGTFKTSRAQYVNPRHPWSLPQDCRMNIDIFRNLFVVEDISHPIRPMNIDDAV
jgi:hypothetical protein